MNELPRLRKIPGYPLYFATEAGDIYSSYRRKEIIKLSQQVTHAGYLRVTMYNERGPKSRSAHSLILETFKGPRPTGLVAAHLNAIRTDNRIENLEWVTVQENSAQMIAHGNSPTGEKHGRRKLSAEDVKTIRGEYKLFHKRKSNAGELSKRFGVTKEHVRNIVRGRTWSSLASFRSQAKDGE